MYDVGIFHLLTLIPVTNDVKTSNWCEGVWICSFFLPWGVGKVLDLL